MCCAMSDGAGVVGRPAGEGCAVEADVRVRIEEALGHESFRRLSDSLHVHAETIRRQLSGSAGVSLRLVAAVCTKTGVSADWLLFGTGPRTEAERIEHALRAAPLDALVAALTERVHAVGEAAPKPVPPQQA